MVECMFVLCVYHFWVGFKPILENCIFWTVLEPFSQQHGQKTKIAKWHPKKCSNQKVEENKLALELNFLSKYNRGGYIFRFLRFWGISQRALPIMDIFRDWGFWTLPLLFQVVCLVVPQTVLVQACLLLVVSHFWFVTFIIFPNSRGKPCSQRRTHGRDCYWRCCCTPGISNQVTWSVKANCLVTINHPLVMELMRIWTQGGGWPVHEQAARQRWGQWRNCQGPLQDCPQVSKVLTRNPTDLF